MYAQHVLTTALLAVPPEPTPTDPCESRLHQVELIGGDDDAQLIGYDLEGEIVGTIAVWVERDGRIFLASDYGDGYAETVVTDGRARTEATLPPEVITARANAMLDTIAAPDARPQEGALRCAVTVAIATGLCAPLAGGHLWGAATCAAGVVSSWCKCAPVLGLNTGDLCEDF